MRFIKINVLTNNSSSAGSYRLNGEDDVLEPGERVESTMNFTCVSVNLTRSYYTKYVSSGIKMTFPTGDKIEDTSTEKTSTTEKAKTEDTSAEETSEEETKTEKKSTKKSVQE